MRNKNIENQIKWGQLYSDFCCPCEGSVSWDQASHPLLPMPERVDRRNFILWGFRGRPTIQVVALYRVCYEIFITTCSNRTSLSRARHVMGTIAYILIKLCQSEVRLRIGEDTIIPDDCPMFHKLEWLCDQLWRAVREFKEGESFQQWIGRLGSFEVSY